MSVILNQNQYGKSRIRLLKVRRTGARHEVFEWMVAIRFEGDFESAHRTGDNSAILPTDTMKNTVYARAAESAARTPEAFGLELARHFQGGNPQASRIEIDVVETPWQRFSDVGGAPHDHAFVCIGPERRLATIGLDRDAAGVWGGLDGLLVMKTTRSAFSGFLRDAYTTLADTDDRIFRTVISAHWSWDAGLKDFEKFTAARRLLVDTFAAHDSRSVQATALAMGQAVLDGIPEIREIRLSLPNQHCLPVDVARFGLENRNEIFAVTEEPHGLITATIGRG